MNHEDELTETVMNEPAQVAVITGASSGIGRATALEFAQNGYDVVLAARRHDALLDVAEECERHGVRAMTVAADVSDEVAVQNIAEVALANFGGFDVWVNDAAVGLYARFEDIPIEEFQQLMDVNLFGYVYGARAALKQFKAQGYGTLINVSSVNAVIPQPYSTAYNVSKFAVRGLSHSLRMELELDGLSDRIHVCNVMPAATDTNFFQNAANYTGREVRALEPVYDPSYVAKHIVRLADEPQREIIVGPAGKMMAMEHSFMPRLYERFMSRFVDSNHLSPEPALDTDGNLYEPIIGNEGTRGGWREKRLAADRLNMALGLLGGGVAALTAIGLLYSKRHRPH